jgi:hypothetical protein
VIVNDVISVGNYIPKINNFLGGRHTLEACWIFRLDPSNRFPNNPEPPLNRPAQLFVLSVLRFRAAVRVPLNRRSRRKNVLEQLWRLGRIDRHLGLFQFRTKVPVFDPSWFNQVYFASKELRQIVLEPKVRMQRFGISLRKVLYDEVQIASRRIEPVARAGPEEVQALYVILAAQFDDLGQPLSNIGMHVRTSTNKRLNGRSNAWDISERLHRPPPHGEVPWSRPAPRGNTDPELRRFRRD